MSIKGFITLLLAVKVHGTYIHLSARATAEEGTIRDNFDTDTVGYLLSRRDG